MMISCFRGIHQSTSSRWMFVGLGMRNLANYFILAAGQSLSMKGLIHGGKGNVGRIWMYNNMFLLRRVSNGFSKAGFTRGRNNPGREGALQEQAGPNPLSSISCSYQRGPFCQYWVLLISAVQISNSASKLGF